MAWIMARDAAAIEPFLARTFPAIAPAILVAVTDLYRGCEMWTTPRIDPVAHARWQSGIAQAHLTDAPIPYGR